MKLIQRLQAKYMKLNTCIVLTLFVLPEVSQAATIETILRKTVTYLQGGVAKSVGLVAIVISGYLCIVRQKLPKESFSMILVGLGIIFGSTSLYTTLVG